MSDQVRYQKLLGSHIGFLERSSRDYDAGHEDESLRLATSMRVVFHDTRSSTSLLTDLDLRTRACCRVRGDTMTWLTTSPR